MLIAYIVTVCFVTALLLSPPLFPFWKVWRRLKKNHPEIWNARGPFDLVSLIATPALATEFVGVINMAERDDFLRQNDPTLVKWCRVAKEVLLLLPKSFVAQVGCFFIFLYFTGVLTSMIMRLFGN